MPANVELYDLAYENYESPLYQQIRLETYDDDLGQTSWAAAHECHDIPYALKLTADARVLDLGCGSGGFAVYLAERVGCRVTGLDLNAQGIRNSKRLARLRGLEALVTFERADISKPLAAANATFDAVTAIDTIHHIANRASLLTEIFRVLKPGGRLIFSDGLVLGGLVSNDEIAQRSVVGLYMLSPAGENERLIAAAGFATPRVTDTTAEANRIATRLHDARKKRRRKLLIVEGAELFEAQQNFIASAIRLTGNRRLLRFVYLTQKP